MNARIRARATYHDLSSAIPQGRDGEKEKKAKVKEQERRHLRIHKSKRKTSSNARTRFTNREVLGSELTSAKTILLTGMNS